MESGSGQKDSTRDGDRMKAIQELMRGKEIAERVESRLRQDTEIAALLEVVIASISRALSSLDPNSDEKRCEISGGKRKTNMVGERRGASRKRIPTTPCRQVISKTENDEYVWRKYGEKDIQNMIYRRSYYRCVHKIGRGCKATKQVQKFEEDPRLYLITYRGEHTCNQITPQLLFSHSSLQEQSLISFGSNASDLIPEDTTPLSSSFPSEDVLRNLKQGSLCSDNSVMPNMEGTNESSLLGSQRMDSISDFGDFSNGTYEGSLTIGSEFDRLDLAPGVQSSIRSLDMSNMNMDYIDYLDETDQRDNDEVFSFDEGEFVDYNVGEGDPFF